MANDAIGRRYALLNKQLQQTEGRQLQQEQDALSRRFAAIGGLGSGASIKADQMASQESSRRLSQGKQALGVAEADERFKQEEIEKGRAFQTSERVGSQDFAAGQAGLQRQFQTGERLGGQEFQSSENALSRRLQEAGLMGYMTDAQGNKIETQTAKDSRLGREQQESQFGRQLAQQSDQFTKDISSRERLAQSDIALKNKAFEAERDYKNADLAWQKAVFEMEFPINKKIAFENLKTAKEASKSEIGTMWNTFTRDPIVNTGDWLSDRLGIKI